MRKRLLRILGVLLVGTIWCQTLGTSILALGWVYRWVGHRVSQKLFQLSPMAEKISWQQFASNWEELTPVRSPPNLFRRQAGVASPRLSVLKWIHDWLHGSWLNWRVGLGGIMTTWVLTLLPGVIWALAWYTGWHISYTKMYEQSATGFSLGFSGWLLYTGMMLYIPSAQARHAFTNDWYSFFDWRFISTVLWHRPRQLLLLAMGYVIANIVLTFFKALPTFWTTINPTLTTLSAHEALELLNQYYFYTGGIAFLLFLALRTIGGNIYSSALWEMWCQSKLKPEAFNRQEVKLFELLKVDYGCRYQKPRLVRKLLGIPLKISYRGTILTLTILVWGVFNFMPFVSEFANYYPVRGFLNQPLVQLPCFRYVPTHLEAKAATEKTSGRLNGYRSEDLEGGGSK